MSIFRDIIVATLVIAIRRYVGSFEIFRATDLPTRYRRFISDRFVGSWILFESVSISIPSIFISVGTRKEALVQWHGNHGLNAIDYINSRRLPGSFLIELISPLSPVICQTACPLTRCLLCELVKAINDKLKSDAHSQNEPATIYTGPPVIRVTLASVEETSTLLSRGLDFYGATYFPTETPHPAAQPLAKYKNNRWETNVCACICSRYAFPRHSESISVYRSCRFSLPCFRSRPINFLSVLVLLIGPLIHYTPHRASANHALSFFRYRIYLYKIYPVAIG